MVPCDIFSEVPIFMRNDYLKLSLYNTCKRSNPFLNFDIARNSGGLLVLCVWCDAS